MVKKRSGVFELKTIQRGLNFEWRLVGPLGARRLHKARIRQQHQAGRRPQHNNSRSKRKDHPTDPEEEPSTLNQAKKNTPRNLL